MKYLHTMVRVTDIDASLHFYRDALGLQVLSRRDHEQGRYTLVFLAAPGNDAAQVELTYNWPAADGSSENYSGGRNFGHLAYAVDDIYAACRRLQEQGVTIIDRSNGLKVDEFRQSVLKQVNADYPGWKDYLSRIDAIK